jgi:hypothetical protein
VKFHCEAGWGRLDGDCYPKIIIFSCLDVTWFICLDNEPSIGRNWIGTKWRATMFHRDALSPEIGMISDERCNLTGSLARLRVRCWSYSDVTQHSTFPSCPLRPTRCHEKMAEIAGGRTLFLTTLSRFLTVIQGA